MIPEAWRFRMRNKNKVWYLLDPPSNFVKSLMFKKTADGFLYADLTVDGVTVQVNPGDWLVSEDGKLRRYTKDEFFDKYNTEDHPT